MKKTISLLLCLALVLTFSITAFAAYNPPASTNDSPIGQGYVTSSNASLIYGGSGHAVNAGDSFLVYNVSGAFAEVTMTSGNLYGARGLIKTTTIYYYLYGSTEALTDTAA